MTRSCALRVLFCCLLTWGASACTSAPSPEEPSGPTPSTGALDPHLADYLARRATELERIPADRRQVLDGLAQELRAELRDGRVPRLLFVCTHNSRRSQMAQLWAEAAGVSMEVPVDCYSGGTEATAFNPRAVAALERAGFLVETQPAYANPHVRVRLRSAGVPIECYSKTFQDALSSSGPCVAVMVCSDADAACPQVPGATSRVALTYEDPRLFDGLPEESVVYDERCAQIAREMLYLMQRARG